MDAVGRREPPSTIRSGRSNRGTGFLKALAFLVLSSMIVVVGSEKMYWYPQGYRPGAMAELVAFYALAMGAFLSLISWYQISSFPRLVVAAMLYALVVEGIVTPVIYEDGPLPVMAVYFFGWHGGISVVYLWYLVRKWSLRAERARLAACSALLGAIWGLWSTTYWRTSAINEMRSEIAADEASWDYGQWPVPKFALFAFGFTGLLMLAHCLIGFVWPDRFPPTRRWLVAIIVLPLMGLVLITFAVPFAPLKLGLLVWLVAWLLGGSRLLPKGQDLYAELAGRVRLVNLLPVLALAAAAVATYAAASALDPSDSVLDIVYGAVVAATAGAGIALVVIAIKARV